MLLKLSVWMLACTAVIAFSLTGAAAENAHGPLSFEMKDIDGKVVKLSRFEGDVVLMVNVASRCGYTKQYKGLQGLHKKYSGEGLAILGFPCNQFGGQEPGSAEDIKEFCEENYGVNFLLFAKLEVNGEHAAPLYKYLTSEHAPVKDQGPIKWNFEKFLLGRDGKVVARYRSGVTPAQIAADIERELSKKTK